MNKAPLGFHVTNCEALPGQSNPSPAKMSFRKGLFLWRSHQPDCGVRAGEIAPPLRRRGSAGQRWVGSRGRGRRSTIVPSNGCPPRPLRVGSPPPDTQPCCVCCSNISKVYNTSYAVIMFKHTTKGSAQFRGHEPGPPPSAWSARPTVMARGI